MDLKTFLKTTDRYVNILKEHNINTPEDFFYYFPRSYEDRTEIKKISQLQEWIASVVKVKVVDKTVITTPKWKKLIEIKLEDEDKNIIYANFLNQTYILKKLKINNWVLISWKPRFSYWKYVFWYPEVFDLDEKTFLVGKIVPIYSDLLWIKWSWFQKKMYEKLPEIKNIFNEVLPDYLLKKYNLLNIHSALENIHFPKNLKLLNKAKYRFNFEKLLIWQLISNLSNTVVLNYEKPTSPNRDIVRDFIKLLPFELTKAQKRAIKAIIDDMHSWKPMTRLLQWDVWSGKTIVSVIVAFYVIKHFKKQVAFLAPTEVLAKQHIKNVSKYFLPQWINIALLTWSTKPKEKEEIKRKLETWEIQLVLWTHAVIQDDVKFKNLWLVIIDEQHKFGVNQRAKLLSQWNPHILQMTATPIPRSLALAYFWEFENTIIDELPPWRQPVYTKVVLEDELKQLKEFFLNKIHQWQQVYIVVPLIEESEKLEWIKSAFEEYEETKQWLGEDIKVALMHWKLSPSEKEEVMQSFKNWKVQVLVSTTVIEVWVDVPNATIMVIKNAERFWLAALHQLRWRVWRSDLKSYCFLVTKSKAWEAYRRLKYMEKYTDGFKLAEIDLKLRWPWTILWTQQSWQLDLPEEALKDINLLEATRKEAKFIIENKLLEKYPLLAEKVNQQKINILKA